MERRSLKAVGDTNFWVSALGWHGLCFQIGESLKGRAFVHITSTDILVEITSVLRHLPDFDDGRVYDVRNEIAELSTVVLPEFPVLERIEVCRDPDDNKFIECAVWGQADYIITRDDDLLSLGEYEGVEMITPETFWKLLLTDETGED